MTGTNNSYLSGNLTVCTTVFTSPTSSLVEKYSKFFFRNKKSTENSESFIFFSNYGSVTFRVEVESPSPIAVRVGVAESWAV